MLILLLLACAAERLDVRVAPPPDLGLGVAVADAAGGLCLSVQLDRWDPVHRDAMVAAIHDLGVREVRHDLIWSYVQNARDAWDWTTEDAWIASAVAADLEIIAMTAYGARWASGEADSYYPPNDPADFATFAGEAAARYGDRIDRWEIWNEPNAGYRFWKVGSPPRVSGDPVGYAALFVPAADAIHAGDLDAEVQIGGTFFHETGIIGGPRFVAEAAASDPRFLEVADALAYHPYTTYPPRVGPEDADGGELPIWEMQAEMREVGGALPLVITEAGWPAWGDVDAEAQAAYLVRGFALAQADGVRDYCAYTLEDGDDLANPESGFGLMTAGSAARKPAGDAFADLAAHIDGLACNGRAEGILGLPDGVYAVRWSSERATATAIWSTTGTVTVTVPASEGALEAARAVEVGELPVWVTETIASR